MIYKALLVLTLLLLGCDFQTRETLIVLSEPKDWRERLKIEPEEVLYQYYESHGLTDVCEKVRIVYKPKGKPVFNYTLPIEKSVQEKVFESGNNFISNKLSPYYDHSRIQLDILNEAYEFKENEQIEIDASTGSYDYLITETGFKVKVFDAVNHLVYIDAYNCNQDRNLVWEK